ncbi:MAG: hypothetical protein HMLKMBBP_00977 [Planctomycetes bacterium]|nr:hypothetical protein [Planctomycetota bacterium]
MRRVDRDLGRFRAIVEGHVRRNLREFVRKGDLLAREGAKTVRVPLPQVELPRFRFGSKDGRDGGVGQGPGRPGEPAQGEAGESAGEHEMEAEVTLEDLARILGEELSLPRIEPRGTRKIEADMLRYRSIRRTGPRSLRHFKRTFRTALRRQILDGSYDARRPIVVPLPEDERFRSFEVTPLPESSAAIVYMMDVSGSMGAEQKEVVRHTAFWLDTWIRSQYRNVAVRYVVHDAEAREVDREQFFHLKESGGTKISSAYRLCMDMCERDHPRDRWNVYAFHFSDGDNWSGGDTQECLDLLASRLLPAVNQFAYGQVKSAYGSGQFKHDLDRKFPDREDLVTAEIADRDGILPAIRQFLGRGR